MIKKWDLKCVGGYVVVGESGKVKPFGKYCF